MLFIKIEIYVKAIKSGHSVVGTSGASYFGNKKNELCMIQYGCKRFWVG